MMIEGSISKYNGLLLLTPSTNPMELFFLVLLWLALTYHPFFPLNFRNCSESHLDFSSISHGSESLQFFFFMLSFQPMNILYKKEGRFSIIFRQSVY